MTTIAQMLRSAAEYIEANGWWNGEEGDGARPGDGINAPTCAALAISGPGEFEATDFLTEFLGLDTLSGVYDWNDAQANGEAVIAKLREAAAAAEEQGR